MWLWAACGGVLVTSGAARVQILGL
jgi:hypothetical protein